MKEMDKNNIVYIAERFNMMRCYMPCPRLRYLPWYCPKLPVVLSASEDLRGTYFTVTGKDIGLWLFLLTFLH